MMLPRLYYGLLLMLTCVPLLLSQAQLKTGIEPSMSYNSNRLSFVSDNIPQSQPVSVHSVASDTNFVIALLDCNWMPDGKTILVSLSRFDKVWRAGAVPVSKVFGLDLRSKQLKLVLTNANNISVSPDGKSLAYVKRSYNNKFNLYIYDLGTKQEQAIFSDTLNKNAPTWSPDGKRIAYNVELNGTGRNATIEICVVDVKTKETKQITQSGKFKSYTPMWSPTGDKIVYYLEKGDNRDQVYLTDANGSFHTNLTSDTSTHNFYPSWMGDETILFTRSPHDIITMNLDGSNKQKIEGISSFRAKCDPSNQKIVYVTPRPDNKLKLFDLKKKTSEVLLDNSQAVEAFEN